MEEHLLLIQNDIANLTGDFDFTSTDPDSAIISDSSDCIGTRICILVEFGFPYMDLAIFVVYVFFLFTMLLLISLVNLVLLAFLN